MRPTEADAARVVERLMAGEPHAPADLVELYLEPLIRSLRGSFTGLPDPTRVDDAAIDALLWFVKQPERFDANRGSLWSFLFMAARRDLINSVEGDFKRIKLEIQPLDVELFPGDRNEESGLEDAVLRKLHPAGLPDEVTFEQVENEVANAFPDAQDQAVLRLFLAGAFRTEEYVGALGIADLSVLEQRRLVKQAKDRIQLRLKRLGKRLRG